MLKLLLSTLLLLLSLHLSSALHPNVTHIATFANGTSIYGLANVYGMLHVIRSDVSVVEVFTGPRNKFQSLKPLVVVNKTGYYDIARLVKANMLVLLNWNEPQNVTIMHMYPPYKVGKWKFTSDDTVAALSVTEADEGDERIIITESKSKSIKVFTKEGVLLKQIFLKSALSPRHAIRTPDNLYAVTFGYYRYEPHYICRFNGEGYVVGLCFGGKPGNHLFQLDVPARLMNTKDGNLLVADMQNSRVLKVSRNLTSSEMILSSLDDINQPYRIMLGSENVLYVADNILDPKTKYSLYGRILAFKCEVC